MNEDGLSVGIIDTVNEQPVAEPRTISSEIDIRSQRISDTHPIRATIYDRTNNFFVRQYRYIAANYVLQPVIQFLFPRVLNNQSWLGFFFLPTTQLLCPWNCEDGHICQYYEGHTGSHKCVFGHAEGPVLKCGHICDCRSCEADCVYQPGHGGIHKCHFRHAPGDIPSNRSMQEAFRYDKSIGDYVDELAYISPEDMKYSHIPQTFDPKDEGWIDDSSTPSENDK